MQTDALKHRLLHNVCAHMTSQRFDGFDCRSPTNPILQVKNSHQSKVVLLKFNQDCLNLSNRIQQQITFH